MTAQPDIEAPPSRSARRRASRPAGPAGPPTVAAGPAPVAAPPPGPVLRLPPRRAGGRRVAMIALPVLLVLTAVAGTTATVLLAEQRQVSAAQARDQRFVDTAEQTVVNMFSFTQDTIEQSVNRFVGNTSGPLRDMLSQNNNVDNLKGMFRDTNASSEAVVNGAALEGVDEVSGNASVLVAVRVTVTDMEGVNKPSQPYRMRVIVHEDDDGRMTAYDLKYPDGGN